MPRGRPKGSERKSAQFQHYNPKKWEAWHESIVIRSVLGASNKDLAEKFGITPQHVSNILNCPQAVEVKERIRNQIVNEGNNVAERVAGIQELALQRMQEYLKKDELATGNPHQTMDRAMQAFKLTMPESIKTNPESVQNNSLTLQQNILVANGEFMERLTKGLEISNQVQEKHRLKIVNE